MERILKDKNIVITGTNRGMGRTMTEYFSEMGANVFAIARKETVDHKRFCKETSEKFGTEIVPVYFDITDFQAMKEAVMAIRKCKKAIHGLVNNAGIGGNSLFYMTSDDELRNIFETDFFGPFYFTQYIVKIMMRQKLGSIVSISSTSALDGNSGKSAYGAAKAALLTMTKSIAEEMGTSGIRANIVCPGVIRTGMEEGMPEYVLEYETEATYSRRLGTAVDVAETVAFLLSDYSSYITGQVIRIDGGKTAYKKRKKNI